MKKIIHTIIEKLTKEEFSQLCEDWDSGEFEFQMREIGLEVDEKNFPEKYCNGEPLSELLSTEDIEIVGRMINHVWNQIADDMFVDDVIGFDASKTFDRSEVYEFVMDRWDQWSTPDSDSWNAMKKFQSVMNSIDRDSEGWKQILALVIPCETFGY